MLDLQMRWGNFDEAFEELEQALTNVARGVTVSAWKSILNRTPQWSGALAASWTYSIGVPQIVDRSHLVTQPTASDPLDNEEEGWVHWEGLQYAGASPAIQLAKDASLGADAGFKLGDVVYISNGAYSPILGLYAQAIEREEIPLRGVNMPGRPAYLTLRALDVKYGKGISKAAAGQLRNLRIGS